MADGKTPGDGKTNPFSDKGKTTMAAGPMNSVENPRGGASGGAKPMNSVESPGGSSATVPSRRAVSSLDGKEIDQQDAASEGASRVPLADSPRFDPSNGTGPLSANNQRPFKLDG